MSGNNRIPKIALTLFLAGAAYLLAFSGQPRMADGALDGSEMYWPEMALTLAIPLFTFATMWIAARRAYFAGHRKWIFLVLFVWPLCFVYTLAINSDPTPELPWWYSPR